MLVGCPAQLAIAGWQSPTKLRLSALVMTPTARQQWKARLPCEGWKQSARHKLCYHPTLYRTAKESEKPLLANEELASAKGEVAFFLWRAASVSGCQVARHQATKRRAPTIVEVVRLGWRPCWVPLQLTDCKEFGDAAGSLAKARRTWDASAPKVRQRLAAQPAVWQQVYLATATPPSDRHVVRHVTHFAVLPPEITGRDSDLEVVRAEWEDSWEHCSQVSPSHALWAQLLRARLIALREELARAGQEGDAPGSAALMEAAQVALAYGERAGIPSLPALTKTPKSLPFSPSLGPVMSPASPPF